MTEQPDIEALAERAGERGAEKVLDRFFERLGVDVSDPLAMQRDFAWVRRTREGTEALSRKGWLTTLSLVLSGMAALLYLALTNHK